MRTKTRDCGDQVFECKRFRKIRIRARLLACLFRFWSTFGCHHQNWRFNCLLVKRLTEVKTVIRSEKYIDDEKIVESIVDHLNGLRCSCGNVYGEVFSFKPTLHETDNSLIIFHDQNVHSRSLSECRETQHGQGLLYVNEMRGG